MANINELPVTMEYIEGILKDYYKSDSFKVNTMHNQEVLNFADVFVAKVFRIKVLGEMNKEGKTEAISKTVIVKIPFRDYLNIPSPTFKFESNVYNKILDTLKFATVWNRLPVIHAFKAEEDIVLTEDFTDMGWIMANPRQGINQQQAAKVIRSLAIFHTASIVLSTINEVRFRKVGFFVQDQVYSEPNDNYCKRIFKNPYSVAKYFANQYLPMANEEETALIQKFFNLTSDEIFNQAKMATDETPEFAKVFVHGDCWAKNFVLKEDNNSEEYALLTNLSTVCLASPARDLVNLFATNCQPLDNTSLIKLYIRELRDHLKINEVPWNIIPQFSVEFIESEIRRLKMVALLAGIWLLVPISYTGNRLVEHYDLFSPYEPQIIVQHIDNELYVRRLMEILREYVS